MDRDRLAQWLDAYIAAWRSYDTQRIVALFSTSATYRYHPYDEPLVGAEAIAASWLEEDRRDEPDTWEAHYEPLAVDGDTAVAVGTSSYEANPDAPARTYHNCFVMRFDIDGRCSDFTEWFMLVPTS